MEHVERVLIIAAKAGAGHLRAAQALEETFRERHPGVEVRNIDVLDYGTKVLRKGFAAGYEKLIKKLPSVWRLVYERLEHKPTRSKAKKLAAWLDTANTRPLRKEVARYDPDRIVCTHFVPSGVLARQRLKGKLRAPLFVALTDYDMHAMWLADGVDRYFVATPAMAHALKVTGIGDAGVSVTGIPIMPVFSRDYPDRPAMREKLGLRPEAPTVVVSAGGFGLCPLDQLANELADGPGDAQFLVVAGRDEKLRKALEKVAAAKPGRVRPYGFVDNMHELMAASDLAVGKPGGLTSSECLAMGLPMVLVKPIPGQEERNADFLLEAGAALRAHSIAELKFKVDGLLADAPRRETMSAAARKAARPRAAYDVVDAIMAPTDSPASGGN